MSETQRDPTGLNGATAPLAERLLFGNRIAVIVVFALITLFFGFQAFQLKPDASFEKMIPTSHPYIQNYLDNRADLKSLGNSIRIIVQTTEGDIFDKEFQDALQKINDEVFYIAGVDRAGLQSIWTPNIRWSEVTEEGFRGGTVIPNAYDGSPEALEQLRANVLRSGQVGRLVANNFRSATIIAPLTDTNPETGERLDYRDFSASIEQLVRDKYETDTIKIRVTGFAKIVGDLIEGATQVALFFAVAWVITKVLLLLYSRCYWATLIPLVCSTVAVVWQLGLLHTMGFGLDPYSMLVPFLVFAIGISHGVQIVNNVASRFFFGIGALWSARRAFRALYIAGFIALISDGIGFLTLMVIEIPVIQELALTASIGVAVLIFTNLLLMPVLLSYTGLTNYCMTYVKRRQENPSRLWPFIARFAKPPFAPVTIIVALALFAVGFYGSKDLHIGDLDPGAPELRPDSRYNVDNAYLTGNYSTSTDVFVTMVETPPQQCGDYTTVAAIDRFQEVMRDTPGVQSVISLVNISKRVTMAMNEGNPKWHTLSRNRYILNNSLALVPSNLINTDCSMVPVLIFLNDHKAETLKSVVDDVEAFAEQYNNDDARFLLAAGNSGIESATNIVISKAQYQMLALVYGVVSFLVLITFRSWRAVLCIVLPLALTSVLGQALMAYLGIGVKVATLPVIALGVGIGVDYGIYIYSKMDTYLKRGMEVYASFVKTLQTTGMAVGFTGITLAIGVGTWIFSPIKFQADMGLMLTFMFLWNMLGALTLLPALAHYLVKTRPATA
ncbi:MAG: MMPL family transporter [Gammaproteobacteria bacterium]|nr:MMPL family transporter [Gammaproteobacteria bacterium]